MENLSFDELTNSRLGTLGLIYVSLLRIQVAVQLRVMTLVLRSKLWVFVYPSLRSRAISNAIGEHSFPHFDPLQHGHFRILYKDR